MPFDPFTSGLATEAKAADFDPFASGLATEEKRDEFDPFASGLANEEAQNSTTGNVVKSVVRGGMAEGIGRGLEGGVRSTDQAARSVSKRAAQGEEYQVLGKSLGELERSQMQAANPTRAKQIEQVRGRMKDMEAAAAPQIAEIERRPGLKPLANEVRAARQNVRDALPVDESFQRSFAGQLSTAAGQLATTLPAYLVPGAGPALTLGQMYQEGYDDAKNSGADDSTAEAAGVANLPAAALDVASDKLIVGRVLKAMRGKVTVGQAAAAIGISAAGEGGAEGGQQVWQNAVAQRLVGYDPDRKLSDEVINSILIGFIVGGIASGAGQAVGAASRPASPAKTDAEFSAEQARGAQPLKLAPEAAAAFEPDGSAPEALPATAPIAAPTPEAFADLTTEDIDPVAAPVPAVAPESQTAAPDEAAVPGERPADSVLADAQPSEAVAGEVTERSGEGERVVSARKGKSFRLGPRADGVTDILDVLQKAGGIGAPNGRKGGEWDGFAEAFGKGSPRLLVRKKGMAVDRLLLDLEEEGYKFQSPDEFYAAVKAAAADRVKVAQAMRAEQDQQRFASAVFDNDRGRQAPGAKKLNTDQLQVGARFMVRGEPFEVMGIDETTGDVIVKDGPRFGTQVLPAATDVYLDKGSVRSAPRVKPSESAPFAQRGEDAGQTDMFAGGQTGGDTLFNLQGEARDAGTAAWSIDEELARREAVAKGKKDQSELLFAQRDPEQANADRESLAAKQRRWRAAAERIAPGLMEKFRLAFGDPAQLVVMGRARPEDINPHVQAAYLAHERMLFLFDQALETRSDFNALLNLLHEMGHAHWDTLSSDRQAQLEEAWISEVIERRGPLYVKGALKRGVAQGVETNVKEWYAERIAWANHEWARGRLPADGVLGKLPKAFRQLLEKLRAFVDLLRGRTIDVDFRKFLDQGDRFADQAAPAPELQPAGAAARSANFAVRPGAPLAERVRDIQATAGSFLRRELTSAAGLPKDVLPAKLARDGRLAAVQRQAEFAVRDFHAAMRAVYGGYKAASQAQLAQINEVLGGLQPVSSLDPRLQGPVGMMRLHIDTLSRRLVREGVISGDLAAKVNGNVGFYLNRSYQKFDDPKWALKVPAAVRARAESFIAAEIQAQNPLLPVNPAEVKGYVEYILGKDVDQPGAFFQAPKEGAKDLSIFTKRKEIPVELRELMGEYTDPRVNYLRSVAKTAQVLEAHRFLGEVRRYGMRGGWLFDRPMADATGRYATKLAADGSEAMAPLNGLFTSKEIAQAFAQHFSQMDDAWRWWLRVNSWVKISKTVLSPMTQARNFSGNLGFMVANGHWRASAAADVWQLLKTEFGSGDTRSRDYVTKLTRLGVVGESTSYGELREALRDAGAKVTGIEEFTDTRTVKVIKAPFQLAAKLYRTNDDIFKVYAFENERRSWAAAMPTLKPEELDAIAAERVRNTLPTYSLIPRLPQRIRRYGLTGSFLSWPSEIIRTGYHTINYMLQDLQSSNPQVRAMGVKRALGITTAAGLTAAAGVASRWLANVDAADDEDLRQFLPEWNRQANLWYQSSDGAGRFSIIDASYLDPWSYLKKPVRAALAGRDWESKLEESGREVLAPFLGEGLLTAVALDLARNQDRNGRPVFNPTAPFLDQAQARLGHVWKAVEPGFATQARRIVRAARGEVGPMGRAYNLEEEVAAVVTGARSQSIDVAQSFMFRAKQFAGERAQAERIYTDVRDRRGNVDPDELLTARAKMEAARRPLFERLSAQAAAAQRLGVPRGVVVQAMLGAGLSAREIGLASSGAYVPFMDSPTSRARVMQRVVEERP